MGKSLETTWSIADPGPHTITVHVDGGVFSDTLRVALDGGEVLSTKVTVGESSSHFMLVDSRSLELRWKWSGWSGKPENILLLEGTRVLAAYGQDIAAQAAAPRGAAKSRSVVGSALVSLLATAGVLWFLFFVPVRTCPHCHGLGSFIFKCGACDGAGKQTTWQVFRSDVLAAAR